MLKKLSTILLSSSMVILLTIPVVSAWSSYASITLQEGQASVTSGEVGLSTQAEFYGENNTRSDVGFAVNFRCMAAYYTSLYTQEKSFTIAKHESPKYHLEKQDIISKYKIRVQSGGPCKELGFGSVQLK